MSPWTNDDNDDGEFNDCIPWWRDNSMSQVYAFKCSFSNDKLMKYVTINITPYWQTVPWIGFIFLFGSDGNLPPWIILVILVSPPGITLTSGFPSTTFVTLVIVDSKIIKTKHYYLFISVQFWWMCSHENSLELCPA